MRAVISFLLLLCVSGVADASRFPPNSNVVDPRNYGAVPNDGLVDSVAIQAAIAKSIGFGHILELTGDGNPATIEEYLVDVPLQSKALRGSPAVLKWTNNLIILCDPDVVIRLVDQSPAFQDPANPHGVFEYGSTTRNAPTAPPASGGGNEGYRNTFDGGGCVIDTGKNNWGAVGINWVANNRAVIRGEENRPLVIRSGDGRGVGGIWMGRPWPGPGLIENVKIEGFDRATEDKHTQYGIVYKNVTINGQRVAGIIANGSASTISGLKSCNTVPAIYVGSASGQVVVLDSELNCGLPTKDAISLGVNSKATVRDTRATGYARLVKGHPELGLAQNEWTSHPGFTPNAGVAASLRLPDVKPPVVFDSTNPLDWANGLDYGANPNDALDDLAKLNLAANSGRPILQLVQGHAGGSTSARQSRYFVSNTLVVPCTVRRVEGMESKLRATANFPVGAALIRQAAGCLPTETLTIERLWPTGKGGPMYLQDSPRPLYLKDLYAGSGSTGIEARAGAGRLFLTNVSTAGLRVGKGVEVYATQFNPENLNEVDGVINDGGTLRILGMKTEGLGRGGRPTLTTRGNGSTEILGGMMMPCVGMANLDVTLGFVTEEGSNFSATYTNWCGKEFDLATWDVQARATLKGTVHEVRAEQLPVHKAGGGNRVFMSLYSVRSERSALLVVGNPASLVGMDAPLQEALVADGWSVTLADDKASTAADAAGKALVVIAPSVAYTGGIGAKFRDVATPVLINKGFALPGMAMSTIGPAGRLAGKTQVTIVNATHPLAACLPAGPVTVYDTPARVQHGRAGAGGVNISKPQGATGAVFGVLGYDAGAPLEPPHVARARRVGFFLGEDATGLTVDGWQLFYGAVDWATGVTTSCN